MPTYRIRIGQIRRVFVDVEYWAADNVYGVVEVVRQDGEYALFRLPMGKVSRLWGVFEGSLSPWQVLEVLQTELNNADAATLNRWANEPV